MYYKQGDKATLPLLQNVYEVQGSTRGVLEEYMRVLEEYMGLLEKYMEVLEEYMGILGK